MGTGFLERIIIAPDLPHGEPCIKGTRIPVAVIVGSLAGGTTPLEIRAAYLQLSAEDIRAALSYAAELTHQDLLVPLPAKEAPVRVKVDEHLPKAAAELLRGRGLDAITVIEQGMGGSKGPVLWNAVRAEGRFLVTADKGFGDIRARPPGNHGGILLLRPEEAGVRTLVELLEDALAGFDLEELAGTVAVATPRGIRIRHGGPV